MHTLLFQIHGFTYFFSSTSCTHTHTHFNIQFYNIHTYIYFSNIYILTTLLTHSLFPKTYLLINTCAPYISSSNFHTHSSPNRTKLILFLNSVIKYSKFIFKHSIYQVEAWVMIWKSSSAQRKMNTNTVLLTCIYTYIFMAIALSKRRETNHDLKVLVFDWHHYVDKITIM
jgi:hypothetical protein